MKFCFRAKLRNIWYRLDLADWHILKNQTIHDVICKKIEIVWICLLALLQFRMFETDIPTIFNNGRIIFYSPSRFNKSCFYGNLINYFTKFSLLGLRIKQFSLPWKLAFISTNLVIIYLIIFATIQRCSGWRYDQRQVRCKKTTQTSYVDQVMFDVSFGLATKRFRLRTPSNFSSDILALKKTMKESKINWK